ncbi:MAG: histidine kinase dimerization/phosphoacceptor domain -containing protein, partial [Owenweeksia sp.]
KAIYYSKKALELEIKAGQKPGEIYSYINLGTMYRAIGNEDSSLYYHNEAIAVGKAANIDSYKITYVNMANIYLDRKQLDTAEYYYRIFLEYAHSQGAEHQNRLAYAYSGMANLYLLRGELEMGKAYADSALELTIIMEFKDLRREVYGHYVVYYEKKGDYQKALEYFGRMSSLKDSLGSAELKTQIETLEARFQHEQHRSQISQLEADNEIKELTLAKAHAQRRLFLILSIMTFLTLAVVVAFWIVARKTSHKLAAKNALIENLIRESHHRIKNNLQVVSSLLHMQGLTLKSKEAQKAIDDAHSRVKAIALLHQRLQGSSDFELIRLNLFLKELCDSILKSMSQNPGGIDLHLEIDEIRTPTDKAISIGLLANEFFTNSLKYASQPGEKLKIHIQVKEDD